MELKKNPSKDIHRRYPMHFFAGLCVSCGLVIIAFELQFKKVPDVSYEPYDWDNAIALVDPDFQIDRPVQQPKKLATPAKVVQTILPAVIEVASDPTVESEVIIQADPFVEVSSPDVGTSAPHVSEEPIVMAEVMPEPVNGLDGFYKQIARELKYPRKAVYAEIEGKVFIEFVIDREGNPTFVKVLRGIGYGCDEEAMKALLKTKWRPGRQRGVPVKVRMVLPIQFALSR
jgi:protein TonB